MIDTLHWDELCFRTSSIMKLYKHQLPNGGRIEEHRHDFHEIFWILSGEGVHEVNGEQKPVARGEFVWIRPADRHLLFAVGREALQFYNLAFPSAIVNDLMERYVEFQHYFSDSCEQPISLKLSVPLQDWLAGSMIGLRKNPESRFALDRFLLNLVEELSRSRADLYRTCPEWLQLAAAELARNPEHLKLGSQALAILAGRSPEHTARELRRCAGITPSCAVNHARIDYAARLLAGTDLSITEIAFRCGFGTLSAFFPAFREFLLVTPLEYRRSHRNFEQ